MKYYFLLLIILPTIALSQSSLHLNCTLGKYEMADLKKFQNETNMQLNAQGIPAKNELTFPMSLQAEIGYDNHTKSKFLWGIFSNYGITKGMTGYSDYSGKLNASQNISQYSVGIKVGYTMLKGFDLYLKSGYCYSKLNLDYTTAISGNPLVEDKLAFHSNGFTFEPGISWSYQMKNILVRIYSGYALNFQGKTLYDKDSNQYLLDSSGKKIIIDWTGFRCGIGVGYSF